MNFSQPHIALYVAIPYSPELAAAQEPLFVCMAIHSYLWAEPPSSSWSGPYRLPPCHGLARKNIQAILCLWPVLTYVA